MAENFTNLFTSSFIPEFDITPNIDQPIWKTKSAKKL